MTGPRAVPTRARPHRRDDAGVALALTLFLIMLIGVLSLSIAGVVLAQTLPTQLGQKNTRTVSAAEAGIEVALNRMRSANDGAGTGMLGLLPCSSASGTVLSGPVAPGSDAPRYSVKIRYYATDPAQQNAAWRTANALGCAANAPVQVPLYALLASTGSAPAVPGQGAGTANRTVEATYRFKVTNVNIPGGPMPLFDVAANALTNWCMAVDSVAAGAAVKVRSCSGADTQNWSYTTNLWLQIEASGGATFCLSAVHTSGSTARLVACSDLDPASLTDVTLVWAYHGFRNFAALDSTDTYTANPNGLCLLAASLTDGAAVVYGSCSTALIPDAKVGAGRAGGDMSQVDGSCPTHPAKNCTYQLVNYKYFGRCIDMTYASVSTAWMIGYFCKEAGIDKLDWNQRFVWDPARGLFCTDTSGNMPHNCASGAPSRYCLYAGSTSTPSPAGTRVLLKNCDSNDSSQLWTRTFDTGSYAGSWAIMSRREGLCLELSPNYPSQAPVSDRPWGMIIINTCSGQTSQKWNAPPEVPQSGLANTHEQAP